jgi:DNA-binding GntR family transcriptional regulator
LTKRDALGAEAAMRDHIRRSYERLRPFAESEADGA